MRAIKFYEQLVPDPRRDADYSTREHPIQSFLWSDYRADVDTEYEFTIVALYGEIGHLEEGHSVTFRIRTEKAKDQGHGVWFNRGAIASHALGAQFQNKMVTEEMFTRSARTAGFSTGKSSGCRAVWPKHASPSSMRPRKAKACGFAPMNSPTGRLPKP